jgi:hypothetical protein
LPFTGELPSEFQELLRWHHFVQKTELEHELARDILSANDWDLKSALETAKEMGHYHGDVEVTVDTKFQCSDGEPTTASDVTVSANQLSILKKASELVQLA